MLLVVNPAPTSHLKAPQNPNQYPTSPLTSKRLESPLWCLKIDFLFLACFCVTSRSRAYTLYLLLVYQAKLASHHQQANFAAWAGITSGRYLWLMDGRSVPCVASRPLRFRPHTGTSRREFFRTSFRRDASYCDHCRHHLTLCFLSSGNAIRYYDAMLLFL